MYIQGRNIDRLFALLRIALFDNSISKSLFEDTNEQDWQQIYSAALKHGVLAIVFDGIKGLPEPLQPDIELRVQWAYNVNHIEKIYNYQLAVANHLTTLLSKHGIKTTILKGLSTSTLYPIPSHRQCGDIDIYLNGDYHRGNRALESLGLEIDYDYFVHSCTTFKGIEIENHQYFVNPDINATSSYIESQLEQLANSATTHPIVSNALMPSADFALLFTLRHLSWHYARESIKIRDLCDWALLLTRCKEDIETQYIMQTLQRSGLERFAAILTTLAVNYLGIDSPLPFREEYQPLSERVLDDIISFRHVGKECKKMGVIKRFYHKVRNRFSRKWCYDMVVPDSFWGNIWYSVKLYIKNPKAIFRAKL